MFVERLKRLEIVRSNDLCKLSKTLICALNMKIRVASSSFVATCSEITLSVVPNNSRIFSLLLSPLSDERGDTSRSRAINKLIQLS